MRQKISLITLGVRVFERSLKFYRDGLGWQPSGGSQGYVAFFQMNGVVFSLYPYETGRGCPGAGAGQWLSWVYAGL